MTAEDLRARAEGLRAEVSQHKVAIRRHRTQLQSAATALAALEEECRKRGINIVFVTSHPGAGDSPWPIKTSS